MVSESDIVKGFIHLGLEGQAVEVHSSLSSFGYVIGGAQTVIRAVMVSSVESENMDFVLISNRK